MKEEPSVSAVPFVPVIKFQCSPSKILMRPRDICSLGLKQRISRPGVKDQKWYLELAFPDVPGSITLEIAAFFWLICFLGQLLTVASQRQPWWRDFPGSSMPRKLPAKAGDTGSIPGSGRSPWRKKWQPTPVFLPGESYGERRLTGYSPWGCKESDMTEWARTLRGREPGSHKLPRWSNVEHRDSFYHIWRIR